MSLINKQVVRQYIIDTAQEIRPGFNCTRVSKEALLQIDFKLRVILRNAVHSHPSKGRTFKSFL